MLSTVQSLGRRALARPVALRGILDLGEPAQSQPLLEALPQLARTVELDGAIRKRGLQRKVAHENSRHRSQVSGDVEPHFEPRVRRAKIRLLAVADQPPCALRCRQTGKFELHAAAAGRERVRLDAAAHVPHQDGDVELVAAELGSEPALAPLAQLPDDRSEFLTGLRQMVLRALRTLLALDHADLLELLQAQAEQAAGHQRDAAMQIAEMRAAAQQFSQYQWRPALAEDLGALGDRAKLTIAFHNSSP